MSADAAPREVCRGGHVAATPDNILGVLSLVSRCCRPIGKLFGPITPAWFGVIKDSQEVTEVVCQEGLSTLERVNDAVACRLGRCVVGGFHRVHAARGVDENLNAGSAFVPQAFVESTHRPRLGPRPCVSMPSTFFMYGLTTRLAMLAASSKPPIRTPRPTNGHD